MAQAAMAKHFSMKKCALDQPLVSLDIATLHMTLMALTVPDSKHLFLLVWL